MKKIFFIIAATALVFAACSEVDTLKKDVQTGNEDEAIAFSSFTQKITRAENSGEGYTWTFYTHQGDFKVWAYKNPNNAYSDQVFNGVSITANSDDTFSYTTATHARYWDKAATNYEFYAAAPYEGGWTFVTSAIQSYATQNKGSFETTSTLSGVNLRSGATDASHITALAEATSSFKGTADVDKLIAAPCSGNYKTFVDPNDPTKHIVQLHFIHILSKMNVTVKKDDNAAMNSKVVKLLSIEFFNLKNKGTFKEANETADGTAKLDRWESQAKEQVSSKDVTYKFENANGVVLSNTDRIYFIESLVIPQTTETEVVDYDGTVTPAIYYTSYSEYNTDKGTSLTEEQFNALSDAEKIKTAAVKVSGTSKPYFVIKYTIDGELFESYHNLATAFLKSPATTLDFYEGYQNTLNINIKPETIEFCADVAAWDDNEKVTGVDVD